MIDALDLIAIPPEVAALQESEQGQAVIRDFGNIDDAFPDFFPFLAQMAGVGEPLHDGMTEPMVNEGKRLMALQLMAILKLAKGG